MSILNITNLTDNPTKWITDKYLDAFEEYEKEMAITGLTSENDKRDFISSQIDALEEYMNESKGSELLGIIDNYLVNLDYYAEVKNWYEEQSHD